MKTELESRTLTRPQEAGSQLLAPSRLPVRQIPPESDKINAIIGWILQGGVMLSAAVILFGLILFPFRPGGFSTERLLAFPETLSGLWAELLVLRPQAVITLGLLLLIATPVLRVSVVAFALERDRRYVVITLGVLAILSVSIFVVGNMVTHGHGTTISQLHFSYLTIILIFVGAIAAGLLGSLVGLGGGG